VAGIRRASTSSDVEIVTTIEACRKAVEKWQGAGNKIGFVPTMGALHEGHLALIDEARRRSRRVVVSIFVNPLQFAPGEDYERYPRDLPADTALAESREVSLLFTPDETEMYPQAPRVIVRGGSAGEEWEGKVRPGHFDGVLTVVAKLFNIVQPDVAVFGQKDLQQAMLVSSMVRDLNLPLEVVIAPTVRDPDGLALSSRNQYLSSEDRATALALPRALEAIYDKYEDGERDVSALESAGRAVLTTGPRVLIDYLAVVERESFRRRDELRAPGAAIGAVRVGGTRLIDNVLLG
jgi:pantoate--beta-alanine ligase